MDYIKETRKDNLVEIILPSKLYSVVGEEYNIYFDNIINHKDNEYDFNVTCIRGAQYENFFRITPDIASYHDLKIDVLKHDKIIASVNSTLRVVDKNVGKGINRKILIIGDSTTANGIVVDKLNTNFSNDVMKVTMLGTKGIAINKHEGISGWTIDKFYKDQRSPFVFNDKFDFSQYMNSNKYTQVDYVFINLGINDIFSYKDDKTLNEQIQIMLKQYREIIENIHSFDSNIRVGVVITIPPAYGQDSFAKAYGNDYKRWRYKRNYFLWLKALQENFDRMDKRNIYLVPVNTNLDTRYNMGIEDNKVNARNNINVKSIVANGNVHPAESGYWQIADVYYFFLKSFES